MKKLLKHKIFQSIKDLKLDLREKTVLTEAATGAYAITPVIAAAAGANVIAFTKDTKYGSTEDVIRETNEIISLFEYDLKIKIVNSLSPEILKDVDIITNSGHLRPINKNILEYVKNETVVSYMYEAWEYRKEDLDLEFCSKKGIRVVATNERHPDIDVFNYLGELAIKLIHDAGKSLYRNKFIIISNNDFGYHIAKTLVKLCDTLGVVDLNENKHKYPDEIEWLGNFPEINIPESYKDAEAIIFTAYPFDKTWIQQDGVIQINSFEKIAEPLILRYAGHIDTEYLDKYNISYYPKFVKSGHMGILLSEIGYDSIIRLQAGGLKSAELAIRNEEQYNNIMLLEKLNNIV